MYAVLETGSKQYRVSAGDTLKIERLAVAAGKPFTFDRVLLVNADGKVTVELTTEWKQYAIDLIGKDLSCIKSGFGWSSQGAGKPVAFYLDDIQYE